MSSHRRFLSRRAHLALLALLSGLILLPAYHPSASGGDQSGSGFSPHGLTPWFGPAPSTLESDQIPLDEFIAARLDDAHMPGLSAVIVKNDQVVWTGTYGYSRVDTEEPITEETIFELASISKTFIATALGQLWEQGLLDLDADVNQYLPFEVKNPHFPDTPITARMLAAHTSTINDVGPFYLKGCRPGDPTISLGQYLRDSLTIDGRWYIPDKTFAEFEPGTSWQYSNNGASLAAYLVEVVSGTPFDEYCAANIFEPLGMTETSLRFADLDLSRIAGLYGYNSRSGQYYRYPFHTCPDYPAGWVMTSALHLSRHLIAFMQGGQINGVRILQPETVEEIRRLQYPAVEESFGLFWYHKRLLGRELIGHNGGNWGVATEMFYQPDTDTGVILLMNGDWSSRSFPIVMSIEDRLFREAAKY